MLLVNTCGVGGVVALVEGDLVIAVEELPGRGTSEHLMPAVKRLFGGEGARVRELGAIAVVIGPGSFTGVRVGLSAMKGLCEAGNVPMIAMSRLALVAAETEAGVEEEVVALLDGGRGEFYCGIYRDGVEVSERLLGIEEVQNLIGTRMAVTCESRVVETLGGRVRLVEEPGAAALLRMTLQRIEMGSWSDVATIDANYVRRTDAELLAMRPGRAM